MTLINTHTHTLSLSLSHTQMDNFQTLSEVCLRTEESSTSGTAESAKTTTPQFLSERQCERDTHTHIHTHTHTHFTFFS